MKSHGLSGGGEIQGLLRQSGETGFALVKTGETVITSEATQNLKDMLKMQEWLGMRRMGEFVFPGAQRMRQQAEEQMKWFRAAKLTPVKSLASGGVEDNANAYSSTLPCNVRLVYSPICKR